MAVAGPRKLAAVDSDFTADTGLPSPACKRPLCGNALEQSKLGRRAEYCGDACRRRHARDRERITAELSRLQRLAAEYGVDDSGREPRTGQNPSGDRFSTAVRQLVLAIDAVTGPLDQPESAAARLDLIDQLAATRDRVLAQLARDQLLPD